MRRVPVPQMRRLASPCLQRKMSAPRAQNRNQKRTPKTMLPPHHRPSHRHHFLAPQRHHSPLHCCFCCPATASTHWRGIASSRTHPSVRRRCSRKGCRGPKRQVRRMCRCIPQAKERSCSRSVAHPPPLLPPQARGSFQEFYTSMKVSVKPTRFFFFFLFNQEF